MEKGFELFRKCFSKVKTVLKPFRLKGTKWQYESSEGHVDVE
jgi:hypothetical protein